ncbi:Glycoside hydrolase family 5 protein [Mycena indigotica]|uniref:glucan 1,3-beta-glucosidase n=1 Tax=Mycena indigotica TaxID=2126181 RepID=A0A8H6TCX3_9AGAR|nr:Glycoside hydrolase family 5 protein [Mycena indigotica]KAF7315004.1 Glycoside hydrolase family 5 protein [Mycena indigotica]
MATDNRHSTPSIADSTPTNGSAALLPATKEAPGSSPLSRTPEKSRRKRLLIPLILGAIVVVVLAVVLPVYFVVIKKNSKNNATTTNGGSSSPSSGDSSPSSGGSSGSPSGTPTKLAVTGGDGSAVVTTSGDSFTYNNSFGGYWYYDSSNPLVGGRANSWTPPLNETWTWGVDRVFGVNLGGWFVLEPFISPALFQAYPSANDEWSIATLMRADGTLQAKMEAHYDTFITEQDIAQIAAAGLNWVRVPIPFWAVSTWSNVGSNSYPSAGSPVAEPFLEGVAWKYIVRLLTWARKYGIRVKFDLHTIPGSQNGYNHSGKYGQVNFLNGPMGAANAQRAVDVIRIITQFIAQEEWKDVVQIFGVMNEPRIAVIGQDALYSFNLHIHDMMRNITGVGAGHGPYISFHDGFDGVSNWAGFLPGSDRVILDTHPYFAFNNQPNNEPIATGTNRNTAGGEWPARACRAWGPMIEQSRSGFGVTIAGEFSNGYNDCGLFLTGVNGRQSYGGDCSFWEDASQWDAATKAGVQAFAEASMDALGDWFFWTWRIGEARDGIVRSPLWSYKAGLEGGWMPKDPRTVTGKCAAVGVRGSRFDGSFSAWQTGGAGAGTIAAAATRQWGQWPPTTLSHAGDILPTYANTGAVPTLVYALPTPTAIKTESAAPTASRMGNGWANAGDTAGAIAPGSGCSYPNAWNALSLPPPTATC